MRVKDRMIHSPTFAVVPSRRQDLLQLFLKSGHAGYPVLKAGSKKLVGTVTRMDLLDHEVEEQTAQVINPNPTTTYAEASLEEAARLVYQNQLRVLPVVNSGNDLIGLITPSELLAGVALRRTIVANLRLRPFVPLHKETPAPVAFEILRRTRVGAMPVLDDEGRLTGIVTDGDLLRAGGGARPPRVPVSKFMSPRVASVRSTAPVKEAADLLLSGHYNQLPVTDEKGALVGLLNDLELLSLVG